MDYTTNNDAAYRLRAERERTQELRRHRDQIMAACPEGAESIAADLIRRHVPIDEALATLRRCKREPLTVASISGDDIIRALGQEGL